MLVVLFWRKNRLESFLNKFFFCIIMEIKSIEDKKNKFVFEIQGVSHGFCNMLKEKLLEDNHVKTATYRVEHPLVNIPKFLVETDSADPKKTVLSAVAKLKVFSEKIKKDLGSAIK